MIIGVHSVKGCSVSSIKRKLSSNYSKSRCDFTLRHLDEKIDYLSTLLHRTFSIDDLIGPSTSFVQASWSPSLVTSSNGDTWSVIFRGHTTGKLGQRFISFLLGSGERREGHSTEFARDLQGAAMLIAWTLVIVQSRNDFDRRSVTVGRIR